MQRLMRRGGSSSSSKSFRKGASSSRIRRSKRQHLTRVLLSLTHEDVKKFVAERQKIDPEDFILYPLLVLSRGLLDREDQRAYGIKHFKEIADPVLKLFWGCVLFGETAASPEIVKCLRSALESKEQSEFLARLYGPKFDDFKRRLKDYPPKN